MVWWGASRKVPCKTVETKYASVFRVHMRGCCPSCFLVKLQRAVNHHEQIKQHPGRYRDKFAERNSANAIVFLYWKYACLSAGWKMKMKMKAAEPNWVGASLSQLVIISRSSGSSMNESTLKFWLITKLLSFSLNRGVWVRGSGSASSVETAKTNCWPISCASVGESASFWKDQRPC